jgi:hypothetical protein
MLGTGCPVRAREEKADFNTLGDFAHGLLSRVCINAQVRAKARAMFSVPAPVGTMCSGSEAPILALEALYEAANFVFDCADIGENLSHVFPVDKDHRKQQFIRTVAWRELAHLFADIIELCEEDVVDVLWGRADKKQGFRVPRADELLARFPCTDNSSLNVHRRMPENLFTIKVCSLRTGACFRGIAAWA